MRDWYRALHMADYVTVLNGMFYSYSARLDPLHD